MPVKSNTDSFIETANLKHLDKYDYTYSDYRGNDQKVIILCKEHGEFLQTPHMHLYGNGCPKCGRILTGLKKRKEEINVPIYYTIIIEDKPFENFFSARIEMDNFSKVLGIYKFIDFLLKLGNLNNSKIIYNDEELIIDSFTPHELMLKLNNSIKIAKENNNKNDK